MKSMLVEPKTPGATCWEEIPEPDIWNGSVLIAAIAAGVCRTDVEIVEENGTRDLRHCQRQQKRDPAIRNSNRPGVMNHAYVIPALV